MPATASPLSVPLWRRLANRLQIDVRPGERKLAFLLFGCFFLVVSFQYATKSVRQSAFLDDLGAANLPWVYLAVALCSYPILRLYTRLSDSAARHNLISATCLAVAASTAAFWWLLGIESPAPAVIFYVWISITYAITYTQFWSLSAHVFDARQAKRLFGFVTAGGLLGGIAGGQVARAVSALADTRATLLVASVMMVALAVAIRSVASSGSGVAAGTRTPAEDKRERAPGGLEIIRGSRQLQLISALMLITIVVAQTIDLQFNWAVEQATGSLDERTVFFGNFYSVMNLVGVVLQLAFTARIHRVLGVGAALRVLPATMGIGTAVLLFSAPFFPAVAVFAALALKVGENGLRYSLDQSSRELLYVPIPGAQRAKARAYIDVFFHRGAKGLAALLLLPVTFGLVTAPQAGWLSLVLVAVWLLLAGAATRGYIRGFRESLKHHVERQSPINIEDTATLEVLVQSMASMDPRQVLHSLQLLGDHGRGHLVSPTLLYHQDDQVRLYTLDLLARSQRRDAVRLIETRLGDDSPAVRAKAVEVLALLQGRDVCELMRPRLGEDQATVRAAAVACLTVHGDAQMAQEAAMVLGELLASPDGATRAEAARAIGAVPEPKYSRQLVELLYDEDQRVLRQAIAAVDTRSQRDGHNPIYTPTLISALRNRRVKHEARQALVAMGEPVIPALAHFLVEPEESPWVRRALPKTISTIGGPAAAEALLAALDGDIKDCFLRRKLIEALRSLPVGQVKRRGAARVPRHIDLEARAYCERLLDLCSLSPSGGVHLSGAVVAWDSCDWEPQLLDRLVAERMEDHLRNLFGLLSLVYPAPHIQAAYRGLISGSPTLRASAIEYLDNALEPGVRRTVLLLIDDKPLAEKLEAMRDRYELRPRAKADTLRAALAERPGDDETAVGIALGALYKIHLDRVAPLFAQVRRLISESDDASISETAAWVAARL